MLLFPKFFPKGQSDATLFLYPIALLLLFAYPFFFILLFVLPFGLFLTSALVFASFLGFSTVFLAPLFSSFVSSVFSKTGLCSTHSSKTIVASSPNLFPSLTIFV